jgi:hypothetical protein
MAKTLVSQQWTSFAFVDDDVRTQLQHSRDILAIAQKLEAAVDLIETESARAAVREAAQRLVSIANGLTVNAMTTTSNASAAVSARTFPSHLAKKSE